MALAKHIYEYAVVRIVPRVDREEFINAGVILFCKELKYLEMRYTVSPARIQMLCSEIDCDEIGRHLAMMEKICRGDAEGGPISRLDMPSRFRWLTATRSTVVQSSRIHPGFCKDPSETLERLYRQLVS